MKTLDFFLFGIYPYIAIAVFLVGSVVRLDYEPYTWKSGSSQFLRRRGMLFASNAFHIGMLALLGGHAVGLLTPHFLYSALGLSAETKQTVAMTAGGIFGVVCMLGMVFLVHRRLTDDRVKAAGSTMDTVILLLLFIQLAVGLLTIPASAQHHDATTMLALAEWAQRILTFRGGAAELAAGTDPVFQAHLVIGLTILLLFPFSRLVHIWSVPLAYLGRRYQLVRRRGPPVTRAG
ncbi:MAG: respiratory nitrate reductase subunit gamma [Solirubrobacterales bacterium]